MRVFRLTKRKYADRLSGQGARITGGRWNSVGYEVIYTASSVSLALLEVLVHLTTDINKTDLVVVTIDIPDSLAITTLDNSILPENWDSYEIRNLTQSIGNNWLDNNVNIALKVPSTIIRSEFNILINPNHPQFNEVNIVSINDISLDQRLIKREQEIINTNPLIQNRLSAISNFSYDIFISHASEDKEKIVMPIVNEINKYGLRYWFDKEKIGWGHSITKKINEGINNSRFVLAVISSNYINKSWAMTELQTALNKQISSGTTIILPLLVGDSKERELILNELYLLRDSLYVVWDNNPEEIVNLITNRLTMD